MRGKNGSKDNEESVELIGFQWCVNTFLLLGLFWQSVANWLWIHTWVTAGLSPNSLFFLVHPERHPSQQRVWMFYFFGFFFRGCGRCYISYCVCASETTRVKSAAKTLEDKLKPIFIYLLQGVSVDTPSNHWVETTFWPSTDRIRCVSPQQLNKEAGVKGQIKIGIF